MRTTLIAWMTVGLTGVAGLVWAQEPAQQPSDQGNLRQATAGSPLYWDADIIMRPYLSLLTRYYNLDDQQEAYTRALMTQRVKRFLSQHERDTRALFTEYLDYQSGGQLPPPEAAKEFAQRARPLLAAMYKEIIDGNMEWREILNDEQKRKHDRDLATIDSSFKSFDEKFGRWADGDIRPTDLPTTVGERPHAIMKPEDAWQYYVRMFIVDYRLDEGQQASAWSLLEEIRKEAANYRLAHKDEFAELDAKYQELTQSDPKTDPKQLEEARKQREGLDKRRQRLEQEISVGMFNRLKQKLLTLPRSDQREAYEQRKAQLDRVAKAAQAELQARTASQPAASSRPATTRESRSAASRTPRPSRVDRKRPERGR